jgi:UDP-N-acetyl-D-mannosaminuronate dehydrogenase
MFKLIALFLICFGIYIGVSYQEDVEDIMDSDTIEVIKEKVDDVKGVLIDITDN